MKEPRKFYFVYWIFIMQARCKVSSSYYLNFFRSSRNDFYIIQTSSIVGIFLEHCTQLRCKYVYKIFKQSEGFSNLSGTLRDGEVVLKGSLELSCEAHSLYRLPAEGENIPSISFCALIGLCKSFQYLEQCFGSPVFTIIKMVFACWYLSGSKAGYQSPTFPLERHYHLFELIGMDKMVL